MKKFINAVSDVEKEMLDGMFKAYPDKIKPAQCDGVLLRKEKSEDKVAVITGGGSGHEPSFGGYVGKGMLDAAVAGAIYTSPAADRIYEAIKAVATEKGYALAKKDK